MDGFLEDYDFDLQYHPRKLDVVVEALSMKTLLASSMMIKELEFLEDI